MFMTGIVGITWTCIHVLKRFLYYLYLSSVGEKQTQEAETKDKASEACQETQERKKGKEAKEEEVRTSRKEAQ